MTENFGLEKGVYLSPDTGKGGGENPIPSADDFEARKSKAEALIKNMAERSGGSLPVEGQFFLDLLTGAEIKEDGNVSELVGAVEETLAYLEGLLGTSSVFLNFDPDRLSELETRQSVLHLRNMFLTTEGLSERPNSPYVTVQLEQSTNNPLTESGWWRRDPARYKEIRRRQLERINRERLISGRDLISEEAVEKIISEEEKKLANEYFAAKELLEIKNYVEARQSIDFAFRQRMATCENPEQASKLGGEIKAVSPDSPAWESFFRSEEITDFGKRVDEVFMEIVKFGLSKATCERLGFTPIPDEVRSRVCKGNERGVFADSFKDTESFTYFIKHLLDKSEGRIDVVWAAWRIFLLWEIPSDLGIYVDEKNKYVMSPPPIGNALLMATANLDELRRKEFGITFGNERTQLEKFVNKSGSPITIGEIPDLCHNFLRETKITFNRSHLNGDSPFQKKFKEVLNTILSTSRNPEAYEKTNDLNQRVKKFLDGNVDSIDLSLWDLRLYGNWGFSDSLFPWRATDKTILQNSDPVEVPSGAFSAWLAKRSRSFSLLSNKDGSGF